MLAVRYPFPASFCWIVLWLLCVHNVSKAVGCGLDHAQEAACTYSGASLQIEMPSVLVCDIEWLHAGKYSHAFVLARDVRSMTAVTCCS